MCDLDFYYSTASPPCRSAQMLAKALGVEMNMKVLSTSKKENLTPEFLKINPQHTVPTLVDNGFALWESRAILAYFVEKYGKDDNLYPKDPKARAVVNQRLFFDFGTLYQRFGEYFYPIFFHNKPADPEKFKKVQEACEFLDGFLAKTMFVAAENVTIADYAIFASFSSVEVAEFDFSGYLNIVRWYNWCKSNLPGVEAGDEGLKLMKERVQIVRGQK